MATVKELVDQMYTRQKVIARKLGVDLTKMSKVDRVQNLSLLILVAVVVKGLSDGALPTLPLPSLTVILNSARDDIWDDEPVWPIDEQP